MSHVGRYNATHTKSSSGRIIANQGYREESSAVLLKAVKQGDDKTVNSLLAGGCNPDTRDEKGRPLIYIVIEQGGSPEILRHLLKSGANVNQVTCTSQQTALHLAARKGYQVCCSILLNARASVDLKDHAQCTALMNAVQGGHHPLIKLLIDHGADINATNSLGESPLHLVAKTGRCDCALELLCHHSDPDRKDLIGQSPLLIACKENHTKLAKLLLQYPCHVNIQDHQTGKSPLHWAVQYGHVSLVNLLLKCKAIIDQRDRNWETPFMAAMRLRKKDVIIALIKAGCDVSVADKDFNTALHMAARDGIAAMIPVLTMKDLNVDLKSSGGITPLMLACQGGHLDTVKTLLAMKANADLVDKHHATALIYTITASASVPYLNEIVKALIRANINVDQGVNLTMFTRTYPSAVSQELIFDDRIHSPLELAFIKGRAAIFALLVQAGCDLTEFPVNPLNSSVAELPSEQPNTASCFVEFLYQQRQRVRPLTAMCRRPALTYIGRHYETAEFEQLKLSAGVRQFLQYPDLDDISETSVYSSYYQFNDLELWTTDHEQYRSFVPDHNGNNILSEKSSGSEERQRRLQFSAVFDNSLPESDSGRSSEPSDFTSHKKSSLSSACSEENEVFDISRINHRHSSAETTDGTFYRSNRINSTEIPSDGHVRWSSESNSIEIASGRNVRQTSQRISAGPARDVTRKRQSLPSNHRHSGNSKPDTPSFQNSPISSTSTGRHHQISSHQRTRTISNSSTSRQYSRSLSNSDCPSSTKSRIPVLQPSRNSFN